MSLARLAVAGLLAAAPFVCAQTNAPRPFAKGVLEKIDLRSRQLIIQTGPESRAFHWTDTTYVFRDKEKISPSQLKTGEVVAVRFYPGPDGKLLIRRMKAYPPP